MGDGELGTGSYGVDRCVSEGAVAVAEEDRGVRGTLIVCALARGGEVGHTVPVEVGGCDSGGCLELIGWQFVVGGILERAVAIAEEDRDVQVLVGIEVRDGKVYHVVPVEVRRGKGFRSGLGRKVLGPGE
jgi:hypothetical protein